jgi:hypothetical protein
VTQPNSPSLSEGALNLNGHDDAFDFLDGDFDLLASRFVCGRPSLVSVRKKDVGDETLLRRLPGASGYTSIYIAHAFNLVEAVCGCLELACISPPFAHSHLTWSRRTPQLNSVADIDMTDSDNSHSPLRSGKSFAGGAQFSTGRVLR